jgi:hypothetical protein
VAKKEDIEELRLLYKEIIDGCSYAPSVKIFFKHFNELEQIELIKQKIIFREQYVKAGIPDEASRLAEVIKLDEWTQDQEDRIVTLRLSITDNERNITNIIPQQQPMIRMAIEKDQLELAHLLQERHDTIGMTCENLSQKDINNYVVYVSAYRDSTCKVRVWKSWEEFEEADEQEIEAINQAFNEAFDRLDENKIRQVSVMPFFLNLFTYAKDDVHSFLNKPISQLTQFQLNLFSLAQRNLSILGQCEGHPPETIDVHSISEIIKWYDQQYSVILGKRNAK